MTWGIQFETAGRDELYQLYKLITFRKLASDDLDYLIEWVTGDKWGVRPRDMILWLERMPNNVYSPLQDIVEVEAFLEYSRRPRRSA